MIDFTHDPKLTSWVASANGHKDFPIQNLPLGLFSPVSEAPRPGTAIGDHIIEWQALVTSGLMQDSLTMEDVLAKTDKTIVEAPGVVPYLPLSPGAKKLPEADVTVNGTAR